MKTQTEDFEFPAVWIVQETGHNFDAAKQFGRLRIINNTTLNRFDVDKMVSIIENALEESAPKDFILISGLTIMNCLACAIFAHKHSTLNLLLYNTKTQLYVPRVLTFTKD